MKRSEPPGKRSKASGCDTKNPPPGYNIELRGGKTQWQKCEEYWKKAKIAVEQKSFRNDIEQQSAIKIPVAIFLPKNRFFAIFCAQTEKKCCSLVCAHL